MTSRLGAIVLVLIVCSSSTSMAAAVTSAGPASAAPPSTPASSSRGDPGPSEPSPADIEKILGFLQDRSAQTKVTPENVNQSFAGLGPPVKEIGKGETGWDFRGEAATGPVRRLNVSFVPASKPNGEYIDPPVWQFKTASFLLDVAGDNTKTAFTKLSNKLNAKLKKPKWKKATSTGWKLARHWEIWLSAAADNGLEVLVSEPDGP